MAKRFNSSHWGAFEAEGRDGRLLDVRPFARDPAPSHLLNGIVEAYDHPTRVRRPAVRASWMRHGPGAARERRGCEDFVEVSWERALALVAGELARVGQLFGHEAIFGGSCGWSSAGRFHHAKTQLRRFLGAAGGFVDQINNYSYGAAMVLLPHVLGDNELLAGRSTSWTAIALNTELLVAFGGLSPKNMQVQPGGCGEHIGSQAFSRLAAVGRVISISPMRSDSPAGLAAEWWPMRPGTDTALMLALATSLVECGLHDREFLQRYCIGADQFLSHLLTGNDGTAFSAEWAEAVCGVPAASIRDLAQAMARKRTFITLSWSLQRADHGEQPYWAAIALAAMLGQIGLPGGGVGFGYGSVNGTGNWVRKLRAPVLPTGVNPVRTAIPVARLTDMLLRPGEHLDYDGTRIRLPAIELIYWSGGNPFHHHQDLNRLLRGWRRPQTIIVNECFWTATARHADVVLPATMTVERNDLGASSGDRYLMAMQQIVPPLAQARNDYDIFVDLAQRLGVADAFTEGRDEMGWLRHLYSGTRAAAAAAGVDFPDFDRFWQQGYVEIAEDEEPFDSLARFRADPCRHRLSTPSGRIELYSHRIASFGYRDCPGQPTWLEPREWLGAAAASRYPLHLLSNQPATRLHSQLDAVGASRKAKVRGREVLFMNAADATARGLAPQDIVRVYNDRGACLAAVSIVDGILPGVVCLPTGAWYTPLDPSIPDCLEVHGNPNVLTHDLGSSSLSQGPAANSALVEVERFDAELPSLSCAQPPSLRPEEASDARQDGHPVLVP
jgi:biotin/methionine sulfoxide reductase